MHIMVSNSLRAELSITTLPNRNNSGKMDKRSGGVSELADEHGLGPCGLQTRESSSLSVPIP
jgi:hypothetical protein